MILNKKIEGFDLTKLKVWACGKEHRDYMFPEEIEDVYCPCGVKAIPYSEFERLKKEPECEQS